jgi:hypothetical protein
MTDHEEDTRRSFSFGLGNDETRATNIDRGDCSGKSSSSTPFSPQQIFQKMHLSHIQAMISRGKERFNKVQTKYRIENIPLPLVKQDIQAGQEWIKGAMLCALVTALIGILNAILTIIAAGIAYSKKASDSHFTYAELYQGDCSITSNWTTGMHLVINVLSSILLAASNYVMQCLSAPSRADIDKAHSKGNWLDIGTLSVRNFWVTDVKSKILWGLLCVSSLPIHMLFVVPSTLLDESR